MKLVIIKDNIKEAVGAAERVQNGESQLPILKNFLLEAEQGKIKIVATNLETAVQFTISGKVLEVGKLAVPSGLLNGVLNSLRSERINLETKDSSINSTKQYIFSICTST